MSDLIPTPVLCTRRLILEPLCVADADRYQALFNDWEVVRYLTHLVPWPYPEGEALRHIREDALPAMADGEEWHWTLRLRANPELMIGVICVMDEPDNQRGFWIAPPWQGQGLMSEACAVVTRFWFETLGQPSLRVAKAAVNEASRRLSTREGMRMVDSRPDEFVCGQLVEEIWEMTREEWRLRNR
ncbi:GNAT family N-acetyltransferase [Pseudomonas sp. dw_358]|uniref:GNAT family N-acetyltransferase n=1 Tax=Pseudomonas sp. dw_358 TaxID=2720083 RepID=UPI001BD2ED37|nr:GNAT family N-acetyltransferase [Pseudomonas sp. dw_358]